MQKNLGRDGWRERKTNLGGVPLKFAPMDDSHKFLFILGKKQIKRRNMIKKFLTFEFEREKKMNYQEENIIDASVVEPNTWDQSWVSLNLLWCT